MNNKRYKLATIALVLVVVNVVFVYFMTSSFPFTQALAQQSPMGVNQYESNLVSLSYNGSIFRKFDGCVQVEYDKSKLKLSDIQVAGGRLTSVNASIPQEGVYDINADKFSVGFVMNSTADVTSEMEVPVTLKALTNCKTEAYTTELTLKVNPQATVDTRVNDYFSYDFIKGGIEQSGDVYTVNSTFTVNTTSPQNITFRFAEASTQLTNQNGTFTPTFTVKDNAFPVRIKSDTEYVVENVNGQAEITMGFSVNKADISTKQLLNYIIYVETLQYTEREFVEFYEVPTLSVNTMTDAKLVIFVLSDIVILITAAIMYRKNKKNLELRAIQDELRKKKEEREAARRKIKEI